MEFAVGGGLIVAGAGIYWLKRTWWDRNTKRPIKVTAVEAPGWISMDNSDGEPLQIVKCRWADYDLTPDLARFCKGKSRVHLPTSGEMFGFITNSGNSPDIRGIIYVEYC